MWLKETFVELAGTAVITTEQDGNNVYSDRKLNNICWAL